MYRVGKNNNAQAHGVYIRPMYVEVWNEAVRQAERKNVTVSVFVNYALFTFMTGQEPSDSPLTGRTPISRSVPVYKLPEQRRRAIRGRPPNIGRSNRAR